MADVLIVAAAPQVYVRNTLGLVSQGANSSTIRTHCYALVRNGRRYSASWDYNHYVNGQGSGASRAVDFTNGDFLMGYTDRTFNHDANGQLTVSGSAWIDAYYGSGTSTSSYTAPRIALEPQGLTQTVTNTQTNQFSISLDISSMGHGVAAAHDLQYKLASSGTWLDTADQSCTDLAPNTFTVTGLTPNTAYNYRQRVWNNMGDYAYGATATITTKSGVKVIPPSGVVEDRTIKQITPAGVVTERIVTKIV